MKFESERASMVCTAYMALHRYGVHTSTYRPVQAVAPLLQSSLGPDALEHDRWDVTSIRWVDVTAIVHGAAASDTRHPFIWFINGLSSHQ